MPQLQWVRAPQQARSQDTLARLLDAAEALLEQHPWEAISVAALVERAHSSVGAFYARFPDKDSLLQHLHQRRCDEGTATATAALAPERWHGVSLDGLVRALVTFTAQDYEQRKGFHREIVRRNSVDERFRERSQKLAAHVVTLMAALLAERINVPDVKRAADTVHRILFSVLDQHVQFSDRAPGLIALSLDELVDEITRAILGYLEDRRHRA